MSWDFAIFFWLNSVAGISPYLNWFIVFAAQYLLYVMVAVFFIFPIFPIPLRLQEIFKKNSEFFIFGMVSSLVARYGVTELIRLFYDRPRPFEALDGVILLVNHPSVASFPSGHAVFSFALALAVFLYYPRAGRWFFLAASLMGIARVIAGVHWLSDILSGALIGVAVTYAAYIVLLKIKKTAGAV